MATQGASGTDAFGWLARAIWLVLLAGGVGIVVSGVGTLTERGQMSARTTGVVVSLADATDYQHKRYFYPEVEITIEGQSRRFLGNVEQQEGTIAIGDTVEVIYDPGDPNTAELAEAAGSFQPVSEIIIGSVLLLLALGLGLRALAKRGAK